MPVSRRLAEPRFTDRPTPESTPYRYGDEV